MRESGIAHFVMLPPGSYLLKGQYRGQLVGRRGLEGRISRAGAESPLARTPMVTGAVPAWTRVLRRLCGAGCRLQGAAGAARPRCALGLRAAHHRLDLVRPTADRARALEPFRLRRKHTGVAKVVGAFAFI